MNEPDSVDSCDVLPTVRKRVTSVPVDNVCDSNHNLSYNLNVCVWNCESWLQKLDRMDVVRFFLSYDIFSLSETYVDYVFPSSLFSDYDVYIAKAKATRLSQQGRLSGGVIVYVRKCLSPLVERVKIVYDNIVVLKLSECLFGLCKPVIMICAYVPPYDSKFWNVTKQGYGFEIIEECVIDMFEKYGDIHLLICGDLNARTGSGNFVKNNITDFLDDTGTFQYDDCDDCDGGNDFSRRSEDKVTNVFGKQLLEICNMFDCIILNGLCKRGFDDASTFISQSGCSVIDYFLISDELCTADFVRSFNIRSLVDSTHLPICLEIAVNSTGYTSDMNRRDKKQLKKINKVIWNEEKETDFVSSLEMYFDQDALLNIMNIIDFDVDFALELFTKCLLDASECMKKSVVVGGTQRNANWFDGECKESKVKVYSLLRIFKRTRNDNDRINFVTARKKYKELLRNKKNGYKRDTVTRLLQCEKNARLFWRELKQTGCSARKKTSDKISVDDWHNHFKGVFNEENRGSRDSNYVNDIINENNIKIDKLDCPITHNEIREAIRKLKSGKACGVDGIMAEMLKLSGESTVEFMHKLFNTVFNEGIYPVEWQKAMIVPIFKKGDQHKPDNYRGISLLSLVSKCYTSILNKRLVTWAEENNKMSDAQAGFRKGYSTIDHIFTLSAIVEKSLGKRGGKLYVCFVDLRKAFDSVRRDLLLEIMEKNGLSSKFMNAILSMYKSVVSCVRVGATQTEFFECPVGLRQGCMLSPILFSIFINEIAANIEKDGLHGIQLLPGLLELFILLFADDIALLTDSVRKLQNHLNILNSMCEELMLVSIKLKGAQFRGIFRLVYGRFQRNG